MARFSELSIGGGFFLACFPALRGLPGNIGGSGFLDPLVQVRVLKKVGEADFQAGADFGHGGELGIVLAVEDFAQGGFGDAVFVGEQLHAGVTLPEDFLPDPFSEMLQNVQCSRPLNLLR
jgi:hypothetical protein